MSIPAMIINDRATQMSLYLPSAIAVRAHDVMQNSASQTHKTPYVDLSATQSAGVEFTYSALRVKQRGDSVPSGAHPADRNRDYHLYQSLLLQKLPSPDHICGHHVLKAYSTESKLSVLYTMIVVS